MNDTNERYEALKALQTCTHCRRIHWRKPAAQYEAVVHEFGDEVEDPFEELRVHKVCGDAAGFAAEKAAEIYEEGDWFEPPCDLRVLVRNIVDNSVRAFRVSSEATIVYSADEVSQ